MGAAKDTDSAHTLPIFVFLSSNPVRAAFTFSFLFFLSPPDKRANSQNMLTSAKCCQYELPEQLFYPIPYKTDTTHTPDTHTRHLHKNRENPRTIELQ